MPSLRLDLSVQRPLNRSWVLFPEALQHSRLDVLIRPPRRMAGPVWRRPLVFEVVTELNSNLCFLLFLLRRQFSLQLRLGSVVDLSLLFLGYRWL